MSRGRKRPKTSIDDANEALPNTRQRIQVSLLSSPWEQSSIDQAFNESFPAYDVDYTVFGVSNDNTAPHARLHRGTPSSITNFGVIYEQNKFHRTYDDVVIDASLRPTPHVLWHDEGFHYQCIPEISDLERVLDAMSLSRLGKTDSTGRYLSTYQRDQQRPKSNYESGMYP